MQIIEQLPVLSNKTRTEIELFLSTIQNFMYSSYYHNMEHILDTLNFLDQVKDELPLNGITQKICNDAIICMLLHDIGHPGVLGKEHIRTFLHKSNFETLEKFHAGLAWDLVQDYKIDLERSIMRTVIEATSLSLHQEYLNRFRQLPTLDVLPTGTLDSNLVDYVILLAKTADLCHFTFNRSLHIDKAIALSKEMDQSMKNMSTMDIICMVAADQIKFCDAFVIPLFKECYRVFNIKLIDRMIGVIEKNRQYWMQLSMNTRRKSFKITS